MKVYQLEKSEEEVTLLVGVESLKKSREGSSRSESFQEF